jgi:hypothetical protein
MKAVAPWKKRMAYYTDTGTFKLSSEWFCNIRTCFNTHLNWTNVFHIYCDSVQGEPVIDIICPFASIIICWPPASGCFGKYPTQFFVAKNEEGRRKENRYHYWANTWRRLERNERETGMLSSRIFASTLILCKQHSHLIVPYIKIPHCCGPTSLRLFLNFLLLKLFQIERHIKTYINVIMVKISVASYCHWRCVCFDWLGHQLSWQTGIALFFGYISASIRSQRLSSKSYRIHHTLIVVPFDPTLTA